MAAQRHFPPNYREDTKNEFLGVIHLLSLHRYQFFPSEINVAATLAIFVGSLIVNTQLLARYEKRMKELSLLSRISMALERKVDLDQALETILEETLSVLGADAGAVFLRDADNDELYVRAMYGVPESVRQVRVRVGEGITGWVVAHSEPYFSPRLAEGPLFAKCLTPLAAQIESSICLPLRTEGVTLGAFHIGTYTHRVFSPNEQQFLATIGSQMAAMIQRTQLLEQLSHPVQERD